MDKGLEVNLDDPAMYVGDPSGSPMWMRDYSRKWFRLEPLKRMIARTILKALSNQTNDWPIKTYRPSNQGRATYPRAVGLRQSKRLI